MVEYHMPAPRIVTSETPKTPLLLSNVPGGIQTPRPWLRAVLMQLWMAGPSSVPSLGVAPQLTMERKLAGIESGGGTRSRSIRSTT